MWQGDDKLTLAELYCVTSRHFKVRKAESKSSVDTTMLARSTLALRSKAPAVGATRNMATLREIELRLKSVRNIEKITKVERYLVLSEVCTSNYSFSP